MLTTAKAILLSLSFLSPPMTDSLTLTPRGTVDKFFRAVEAERWLEAAELIDSATFARFLRAFVGRARVALPSPSARAKQAPRGTPQRGSSTEREWEDYSRDFAGVSTFQMLRSLTPLDAAARWLQANDPISAYTRTVVRCSKVPIDVAKVHAESPFRRVTIAEAIVADGTAYVLAVPVSPLTSSPFFLDRPSVLTLREREGRWFLVTSSDLLTSGNLSFVAGGCD